jgi:sensor c-di-GMP phosphodiesterase-like protein
MSKPPMKDILASVFAEYQPIIDLAHNRMVGCEALARWTAKDGKVTTIGDVIDEVEADEGLAMDLTTRMLGFIRKDLAPLLAAHPHFTVSVNIPPIMIGSGKVISLLEDADLAEYHSQLVGEITERQALNEMGRNAIRVAREELGMKVAIDDFGTGQSGLQQLLGLEVDILKIDQSFIELIGKDIAAERLVRAIAALATVLNVEVVAEGVETADQASFLRAIGINKAQGWLWSKAIGPLELETWLEAASA